MRLAIDIDNVLNDLVECVLGLYNSEYNDNLKIKDITAYSMECFVKKEARPHINEFFQFAVPNTKPRDGAVEYMSRLYRDGHDIYCVTSSHFDAMPFKVNWIQEHFPFVPDSHVVRLCDKSLFKCDVMVDDYTSNLILSDCKRVILDYPWNHPLAPEFDGFYRLTRVSNWEEIYKTISKYNNRGAYDRI